MTLWLFLQTLAKLSQFWLTYTFVWTDDLWISSILEMAPRHLHNLCKAAIRLLKSLLNSLDSPIVLFSFFLFWVLVSIDHWVKQILFILTKTNYQLQWIMITEKLVDLGLFKLIDPSEPSESLIKWFKYMYVHIYLTFDCSDKIWTNSCFLKCCTIIPPLY